MGGAQKEKPPASRSEIKPDGGASLTQTAQAQGLVVLDESLLSIVREIGGPDAVTVTKILVSGEEFTDEKIAEITGLRINIVRKALYTFFDNQLVSYRRIRDKDTGWYIYYWKLNFSNIEVLIRVRKQKVLEKLKMRLNYEKGRVFFYCASNGCVRIPFEEAVELSFKCPRCGSSLENEDNSGIVSALEERITLIEQELTHDT